MTPRNRWSRLLAVPVLVLALTGCRLHADVLVEVDVDGGGTLAVTLDADDELMRMARDAGADPLATLADVGRQLPGWRVDRPAAEAATVTLETTFDDPAELERISEQFARAVAAPELRPLEPLRLTVADDTVELRGGAGLRVTTAVREIGYSRRRARRAIADSVRLRVTARMPGDVLETNAQRDDDRTVSWTVPAGERRQLRVLAARPWTVQRLLRRLAWPLGAGAVVIAVLVAVVAARRRSARGAPTS